MNAAFAKGYLHGGMKDWALALCQSDEVAFDKFLEQSGPVFGHLLKPYQMPMAALTGMQSAKHSANSPDALAICAQLGLKPDALQD